MKQFTLTIGANNETKEVETDKIFNFLSSRYEGFTVSAFNKGFWKGESEDSIRVSLVIDEPVDTIKRMTAELRDELKQQAIMLEISDFNGEFI